MLDGMTDAAYRVQQVKEADTGYGAVLANLIPVSAAGAEHTLKIGDYVVLHEADECDESA